MSDLDRLTAALADRYDLQQVLGRGGMATVYLARDVKHDRKVAVKVLRPELAAAVGAERFLHEVKVTANLQHPHILALHDSGEVHVPGTSGSMLYYVMPYVEGESLREKLNREKQLSIDEAVEITKAVASALDYAHRQGVIHRDIKPENILLHDGQPIVADFGIALAVSGTSGPRLTDTGLSVGTPHYMSPEQATGDRDLDGRSDVYALGAVLYEMLSGEPPHPGSTAQVVVARILSEQPTPLRKLRDTVPEAVDAAVSKALNKTRADRFPTPAEFAAAVTQGARGDTLAPADKVGWHKRSRVLILALAGVVVAVGAALTTIIRGGPTPALRSVAVLPLDNISGDSAQEYFVQGIHDALINELSQISALERVTGRRSVMRFRDSPLSYQEIAAVLNVDALVEASVLRVDDDVRINVRLVQASTERDLWATSYQDKLEDVLTLQRRVTNDIAREIALTLTPGEAAHLADTRTINPAAYEHYLRGRFHWNKRTGDGFGLAVESFNSAIELDSTYAEAYAGLSDAYSLLAQYNHIPLDEGIPMARRAAERAVALDSSLADAHTSLAEIHFVEREWDDAEQEYRQAIMLNPAYATAHHFYGWFLSHIGRHDEAIAELERARELDPLATIINTDLAAAYFAAGRNDDARNRVLRTLADDPDFPRALSIKNELDVVDGNFDQAIADTERLPGWWGGRINLAYPLAAAGRQAEAREIVREGVAAWGGPQKVGPYVATHLAIVYVTLADHDAALTWLEHAVDRGLGAGPYSLKTWPAYDPLRSNPRFQALIERMGFPD